MFTGVVLLWASFRGRFDTKLSVTQNKSHIVTTWLGSRNTNTDELQRGGLVSDKDICVKPEEWELKSGFKSFALVVKRRKYMQNVPSKKCNKADKRETKKCKCIFSCEEEEKKKLEDEETKRHICFQCVCVCVCLRLKNDLTSTCLVVCVWDETQTHTDIITYTWWLDKAWFEV